MLVPALLLFDVTNQAVWIFDIPVMILLGGVPPGVKETVQGWESVFEITQVKKTEEVVPRHRNHQATIWPQHAAYLAKEECLVVHVLQDIQKRYQIKRCIRKWNFSRKKHDLIGPFVRLDCLAVLVHPTTRGPAKPGHAVDKFALEATVVQKHVAVLNRFESISESGIALEGVVDGHFCLHPLGCLS